MERFRVDFDDDGNSYASYSTEVEARELYSQRGVRLLHCKDIHDRGTVIDGAPLVIDLQRERWNEN